MSIENTHTNEINPNTAGLVDLEDPAQFGEAAGLTPEQIEQEEALRRDMAAFEAVAGNPRTSKSFQEQAFSTAILVAGESVLRK